MFRFKDTFLPLNRTVCNSLTEIYGVGLQRALYATASFGYSAYYSINLVNHYYFESMAAFLKKNFSLEDRLKFIIKNRFFLFRDLGLVKVKRYDVGLPNRGQRTHTNSQTPRRNRIF